MEMTGENLLARTGEVDVRSGRLAEMHSRASNENNYLGRVNLPTSPVSQAPVRRSYQSRNIMNTNAHSELEIIREENRATPLVANNALLSLKEDSKLPKAFKKKKKVRDK